jgi:hypothetical protein
VYKEHPVLYISLLSIFSSLYAVISLYPIGFPIIGLESARPIQVTQFIAILYGYLFGPVLGSLAVGIGGFISSSITITPPFYQLNFLPAYISAFVSGLSIRYKKGVLAVFLILWASYFLYPNVGPIWLFPYNTWFHIVAFILYTFSITFLYRFRGPKERENIIIIFATSLLSTITGQLLGATLFQAMYYPTMISTVEGFRIIWITTTFIYPIERLVIAVLATLAIIPIYRIINKLYPQIIYR